jgi:hypothetical protein
MKRIVTELQGKKSYIVACAIVAYALLGVYTGQLTQQEAVVLVFNGLGLGALRASISKV